VVKDTIKEAVAGLQQHLVASLNAFREENDRQLSSTSQELKHLKRSAELSFRFKGNKLQYQFNAGLQEKLEKVKAFLQEGREEAAKSLLDSAIEDTKKRNKLIRIADKSDAG
jgi:hypothetical protein